MKEKSVTFCFLKLKVKEKANLFKRFELLTRGFELVSRGFKLVTRGLELVTRGFELVLLNINSCF